MYPDQESQLLDKALFLTAGKKVATEARSPSGYGKPIVTRQFQGIVQEIVELFPKSPVAAVDRRGANAVLVELQ